MHIFSKLSIHFFFIGTITFLCLSTENDLTVYAQEHNESSFKENADTIFSFISAKSNLTEKDQKSLRKMHLAATEYEQSRLDDLDEIELQANLLAEEARLTLMLIELEHLIELDLPDEIELEVNILAESARLERTLFKKE